MDIERALLKAGVTLAALFAIYQSARGVKEFAAHRSEEARQEGRVNLERRELKGQTENYIESLKLKETERRQKAALDIYQR